MNDPTSLYDFLIKQERHVPELCIRKQDQTVYFVTIREFSKSYCVEAADPRRATEEQGTWHLT